MSSSLLPVTFDQTFVCISEILASSFLNTFRSMGKVAVIIVRFSPKNVIERVY